MGRRGTGPRPTGRGRVPPAPTRSSAGALVLRKRNASTSGPRGVQSIKDLKALSVFWLAGYYSHVGPKGPEAAFFTGARFSKVGQEHQSLPRSGAGTPELWSPGPLGHGATYKPNHPLILLLSCKSCKSCKSCSFLALGAWLGEGQALALGKVKVAVILNFC